MTTTKIVEVVDAVCHQHDIRCLHAIESGSRAWGFSSIDSDYDVRMIYCHTPQWYLSILDKKDSLEFIDDTLFEVPFDIGGWEIKKALLLLYKSNAVVFEWINSPIVYHTDGIIDDIKKVQEEFFNPQACFYHYQGMAKTASEQLDIEKPLKLKRWFYLLRALLASVWLIERQSLVPVAIHQLFELLSVEDSEYIADLIQLKHTQNESSVMILPASLQALTHKLWQRCQSPTFNKKQKGDIDKLDNIFKKAVGYA